MANTKYTPEVADRIVQALELGATDGHAALYGGISWDTFDRWRKKNAAFAARVSLAKGKRVVRWLGKIEQAANDDWRAALAKLQVCERETYGKQVMEQQLTGKDGEAIVIVLGERSDGPQ